MMHWSAPVAIVAWDPATGQGTLRTDEEFEYGLGPLPRIVHISPATLTDELLRDSLHPGVRVIADYELIEDDDGFRWKAWRISPPNVVPGEQLPASSG